MSQVENAKDGRPAIITDWSLQIFQNFYNSGSRNTFVQITKADIFHYIYAVLNNPVYRVKYALNLKKDSPRIPLYDNFCQWAQWGKQLMDLHLNYEKAAPYELDRLDKVVNASTPEAVTALGKAKLKAVKDKGYIILDGITELHNIPAIAWE